MTEAEIRIPWLPSCETIARVARHLGCTPEAAELQIISKGKGGQIKARGVIETRPVSLRIVGEGTGGRTETCGVIETRRVSPLPAAWNGTVDLAGATMRPPEASYEITNLELCFIDLIAAGLLPAPAERARWLAAEAIAYLVKGVPLPWAAWQEQGAAPAEIEQAKRDLAQAGSEGVPAWGWHPLKRERKRIPSDHFRDEMIEMKAVPVSVAHLPKVIVDCQGSITTSPRQRFADYQGPRWEAIEFDAAALRRARPRPVIAQAEPVPSLSKLSVQEPPPEEAEQQRPPLLLPDEPQFEGPRKWRPDEAQTWFANAKQIHPPKPGENKSVYARRLYEHMKNDFGEDIPWTEWATLRRRLNDPSTEND